MDGFCLLAVQAEYRRIVDDRKLGVALAEAERLSHSLEERSVELWGSR